jgi:predicted trehalose synthase
LFCLASINAVPNEQIEADVEQLVDLMKTRKQQLEDLLSEKIKDFGLICVLENVRWLTSILDRLIIVDGFVRYLLASNRCNN